MNQSTKSGILFSLILIVLFACFPEAKGGPQPDIVFVLADDLGYTDLACYGSNYYETPHIDRLAAEGMRFTNFHQSQNCQPSRAAMMTGQYSPRTGVYTVGNINRFDWHSRPLRPVRNETTLPLDKTTIAQSLKSAGYATAMFGKWHLGQQGEYAPENRGFDEAIVTLGRHFNFKTQPPVDVPEGTYLADFLTDKAEDFIRRKKDETFFLMVSHYAVHSPYQAKQKWVDHFEKKVPSGGHENPVYAGMIASVDESVGRLVALLDELKLSENTLFLFAGDNGGVGGYEREGIQGANNITDNAPLRSGKGSLYGGGVRTPLIARWPGKVKPNTVNSTATIHVDLPATWIDLARAPLPEQPMDGESLLPLLLNPNIPLRRNTIFQHMPGYLGANSGKSKSYPDGASQQYWRTTPAGSIQMGDWKLIEFFEDGRLELYDLSNDIGEKNNLASENPAKTQELHSALKDWRKKIDAPMPEPNTAQHLPANKKNSRNTKPRAKQAGRDIDLKKIDLKKLRMF